MEDQIQTNASACISVIDDALRDFKADELESISNYSASETCHPNPQMYNTQGAKTYKEEQLSLDSGKTV